MSPGEHALEDGRESVDSPSVAMVISVCYRPFDMKCSTDGLSCVECDR